ncbi:MAG TPA: aldo/keto reductase [Solirubrobacteraceae bacterium]
MRVRTLGAGGLEVSAIGLGCMGMSQGYGPADERESLATLHAALDAGVTLLDTAMSYGAGANERLLSRVLATRGDEVVLATKFGIARGPDGVHVDARPERVRSFLESSLSRLGVDHVDLCYLHRVDPAVPIEETVGAMGELVTEGKVGHLGVSETTVAELERAAAVHRVAALQIEWSLAWRECEDELIPAARRLGVGIVPYSPLGRGLLTGRLTGSTAADAGMRSRDPRFAGPALERNLELVQAIAAIAREHHVTSPQLALAWLLAQGEDVVPIPGTKRPGRLAENVAATEIMLSPSDLGRLEAAVPRQAWAGDRFSFAAPDTQRSTQ